MLLTQSITHHLKKYCALTEKSLGCSVCLSLPKVVFFFAFWKNFLGGGFSSVSFHYSEIQWGDINRPELIPLLWGGVLSLRGGVHKYQWDTVTWVEVTFGSFERDTHHHYPVKLLKKRVTPEPNVTPRSWWNSFGNTSRLGAPPVLI